MELLLNMSTGAILPNLSNDNCIVNSVGDLILNISLKGLLFDIFTNARFGYSLKKLNSSYSGACIKVRRSSDNSKQDIGFVNNTLDINALHSFLNGSDGYVNTWYDQSGNGYDLSTLNPIEEPKIATLGSVILEQGNPTIEYSINSYLYNQNQQSFNQNNYLLSILLNIKTINNSNPRYIAINGTSINMQFGINSSNSFFTRHSNSTHVTIANQADYSVRNLITHYSSSSTNMIGKNSNNLSTTVGSSPTANSLLSSGVHLFKGYKLDSYFIESGNIQEFILFDSDQLSNKEAIETKIMSKY